MNVLEGRVMFINMLCSCYPVRLRTRGRVITLSVHPWVCLFVCMFVCVRHKNEHFE